MPKVFGIHELELKPGADAKEFERFMTEEALPTLQLAGSRLYFLKGDRGERDGKYLLVLEFDSVEDRNRAAPTPNTLGEETQRLLESQAALFERWKTFASSPAEDETVYTDYVEVGKQPG